MTRHQPQQLAKLLRYILGRRPDEFGLVLDSDGFAPLKELLQAIKEEEGWSYVRLADLREVLMIEPDRFEVRDDRIRSALRELPGPMVTPGPVNPPETLYFGARQKAYPHILSHGLVPARYPHVCLASREDLALRIGRRRDPNPVLIKIQATRAHEEGISFSRFHELIYLVASLPPAYLNGPPLPREKPTPQKTPTPKKKPYEPPGSFEMDIRSIPKRLQEDRERRSKSWKREARRYRKSRERERS